MWNSVPSAHSVTGCGSWPAILAVRSTRRGAMLLSWPGGNSVLLSSQPTPAWTTQATPPAAAPVVAAARSDCERGARGMATSWRIVLRRLEQESHRAATGRFSSGTRTRAGWVGKVLADEDGETARVMGIF